MIDLKYELSNLGIDKELLKINSNDYLEIKKDNNFFYKLSNKEIKNLQKKLSKILSNKIEVNSASIAYKKNYSYLDFIYPHKESYNFVRLDIKKFFHSIKEKYIRKVFENYFKNIDNQSFLKFEDDTLVIDSFINLITLTIPNDSNNVRYRNVTILPIGFITSPIISNILFRPLDIQIQRYCKLNNILYSRYADDMLFSSQKKHKLIMNEQFINDIQNILFQFDFELNTNKIIKTQHTLSLNGYTINNSEIRISNKKIKIIKKLIHFYNCKLKSEEILWKLFKYKLPNKCKFITQQKKELYYKEQLLNKLTGYRSFLISILNYNNKKQSFSKNLNTDLKYKIIISDLEEIIFDLTSIMNKI